MNIPAVPKPVTITFFDRVVVEIQDILKEKLSWLDYSFGQCQRLVTKRDKSDFFYPGVHIGNGTYISVLPDQELGNFSFIHIDDPQNIKYDLHSLYNSVYATINIIFWFNLKGIFPSAVDRNLEVIKRQMLKILTKEMFLTTGSLGTNIKIYQKAENIFKGYNLKEIDSQYLMHPYAGLRFESSIHIQAEC
jgi:hypothetical protein